MTNAGLPVPPGFTIQTEACREYMRLSAASKEVDRQMEEALAKLESLQGQKLGKGDNPLLVSVRSGAKFSMPGMMDTILNLGLNDQSVEALARRTNNPRFAYDSYRRLIQMFGNVVLDIEKPVFDEIFDVPKKKQSAQDPADDVRLLASERSGHEDDHADADRHAENDGNALHPSFAQKAARRDPLKGQPVMHSAPGADAGPLSRASSRRERRGRPPRDRRGPRPSLRRAAPASPSAGLRDLD